MCLSCLKIALTVSCKLENIDESIFCFSDLMVTSTFESLYFKEGTNYQNEVKLNG